MAGVKEKPVDAGLGVLDAAAPNVNALGAVEVEAPKENPTLAGLLVLAEPKEKEGVVLDVVEDEAGGTPNVNVELGFSVVVLGVDPKEKVGAGLASVFGSSATADPKEKVGAVGFG